MPSSTRSRSGDDATAPMTAYRGSLRGRPEPSPFVPAEAVPAGTGSGSGVDSLAKAFAPGGIVPHRRCAQGVVVESRLTAATLPVFASTRTVVRRVNDPFAPGIENDTAQNGWALMPWRTSRTWVRPGTKSI